jgi:hypothetical protein
VWDAKAQGLLDALSLGLRSYTPKTTTSKFARAATSLDTLASPDTLDSPTSVLAPLSSYTPRREPYQPTTSAPPTPYTLLTPLGSTVTPAWTYGYGYSPFSPYTLPRQRLRSP